MNLQPFTPPKLPDREEALEQILGTVEEAISPNSSPASASNVADIRVGVMRWEPVVAKLVASGTGPVEAAGMVKVPVEQVVSFLAGRGKEMVKAYIGERPARLNAMLEGMKVDVVMVLGKILHTSKQDSARVAAAKQLLDLAQDARNRAPKSPEQVKREAEQRIAKKLQEQKDAMALAMEDATPIKQS